MTDPEEQMKLPDPGNQEEAEGDPQHRRPQDQGEGPGYDTADRPPAEGEREDD